MEEAPRLDPVITMACDNCGSNMAYDAKRQLMLCPSCQSTKEPPKAQDMVIEKDFNSALALDDAPKGMGTAMKSYHCENCGANTMVDPSTVGFSCSFCGSSKVNEAAYAEKVIKPAGILPFAYPKDKALEAFKTWVGKGLFVPNDLAKRARLAKIDGVYVPFWTYDAETESYWTAEAGYYYYETEYFTDNNGQRQSRQVRKTRWVPANGYYAHNFDDVLVVASGGVKQNMMERINNYNLGKVVNYDAQYMIGWMSEVYAKDVKQGFEVADKIMNDFIRTECGRQVPGDTYRNLDIHTRKDGITFKHILLPLWIAAYQYGDSSFQFLINGETGKIAGDKPTSWIKVTIAILLVLAIIATLVWYFKFRK